MLGVVRSTPIHNFAVQDATGLIILANRVGRRGDAGLEGVVGVAAGALPTELHASAEIGPVGTGLLDLGLQRNILLGIQNMASLELVTIAIGEIERTGLAALVTTLSRLADLLAQRLVPIGVDIVVVVPAGAANNLLRVCRGRFR